MKDTAHIPITESIRPFWQSFLGDIRHQREEIWDDFAQDLDTRGETLPDIAEDVRNLYLAMRIDFDRVRDAIAIGSLEKITIDPAPDEDNPTDNDILDAWSEWFFQIEDAVCEASGYDTITFSNPEQEKTFEVLLRHLHINGHFLNPLY